MEKVYSQNFCLLSDKIMFLFRKQITKYCIYDSLCLNKVYDCPQDIGIFLHNQCGCKLHLNHHFHLILFSR